MSRIYTPARAHNAKSKAVEPFFSLFSRKYCQGRIDRGGFGVASGRDLQPSGEFLGRHRHAFPASFIERERAGKRDEYASLFGKLPEERRTILSGEQYLLMSGEGAGLRPTLLGEERAYDCFASEFREYARVRWSVKCAPDDLERVLAVNGDGTLRFLPERKHVQPMALAGRKEGDAGELSRVSRFNGGASAASARAWGRACEKAEQLFGDQPQLDVGTRPLLCDSRVRNKAHKRTSRSAPPAEDEENVFNLYWQLNGQQ